MKTEEIYQAFAFPDSCLLERRIFKKLFLETGKLTATDKRALSQGAKSLTWQYTLKPSTLAIEGYRDAEREYDEIAVIEVELLDQRHSARLTELVHRSIPYPLILVLSSEDRVQISAAPKRLSRAETGQFVVESIETTPWLGGEESTQVEQAFLASIATRSLPHTHVLALYDAWRQRILALSCAQLTHVFAPRAELAPEERRRELDACLDAERHITKLRSALRKETGFARKLELNVEIKALETDLSRRLATL